MVWRDSGVSRIITDEVSPAKDSTMALGPDTDTLGPVREKTSKRITTIAAAGTRNENLKLET